MHILLTPKELDRDPLLHRFVIVFDRECSNYKLISQLWQQRIGAITYRKNVKDKWPVDEFVEQEVPVLGGHRTKMKLAMRETTLGSGQPSILCDRGTPPDRYRASDGHHYHCKKAWKYHHCEPDVCPLVPGKLRKYSVNP